MNQFLHIAIFLFLLFSFTGHTEAKKIKTSLKIEKKNGQQNVGKNEKGKDFIEIKTEEQPSYNDSIRFSGYEKEINSSLESFLVSNLMKSPINSISFRIIYLDMQGRMIHSRILNEEILIPPHETRKADIKSWDKQKTYYYYLGNEPKKVATPYKVRIEPVSISIKKEE